MTDQSIWLRDDSEADRAILALIEATALTHCTTRVTEGEHTRVTTNLPIGCLSGGEQDLWWLVAEMSNVGQLRQSLSRICRSVERQAALAAVSALLPVLSPRIEAMFSEQVTA